MGAKDWVKIVLGMLVIAVIGIGITKGIERGKRTIGDVVDGSGPISVPMLGLAFRIDGEPVGGIDRLQFLRSAPKVVDSVVLAVDLSDPSFERRFEDCMVAMTESRHFDKNTSFTCATPEDSARLALQPFGHVRLQPSGQRIALWVPEELMHELRRTIVADAGDEEGVDVTTENDGAGNVEVKINGRELVSVKGDSAGGGVVIRDANGKVIVDIGGDSTGGHVRVNTGGNRVQSKVRRDH